MEGNVAPKNFPKIRIFAWRTSNNAFPIMVNLSKRGIKLSFVWARGWTAETITHSLLRCIIAREARCGNNGRNAQLQSLLKTVTSLTQLWASYQMELLETWKSSSWQLGLSGSIVTKWCMILSTSLETRYGVLPLELSMTAKKHLFTFS